MSDQTRRRKVDHISICLKQDIECKNISTGLEYVHILHNALPEMDLDEVDTTSNIFGYKISFPLIFDSITGGSRESKAINRNIAEVAKEKNLALFLGSIRPAIEDPNSLDSYTIARDVAPETFIGLNIGASQLSRGFDIDKLKSFINNIKANALSIHLNPLQESIQVEGEPLFKSVLEKIHFLVKNLGVPIVVKEVGCGISREVASKLELAGVSAINVAGLGGTNWATVESLRAKMFGNDVKAELGALFSTWGIPTAVSIIECAQTVKVPVIASGGIRSGLDMAKALVLGAKYCSIALPVLRASKSISQLSSLVDKFLMEFKVSMFLAGCRSVEELKSVRYYMDYPLRSWIMR
ncbi:MAG: type 2 isopentenyl-diphosphate Delta-isomerase [Nitrososphaeria archaeon]|nr:type 2 isopentenyl-diphosphate Delta-isomerase [Nitrososphaeria archaeon]